MGETKEGDKQAAQTDRLTGKDRQTGVWCNFNGERRAGIQLWWGEGGCWGDGLRGVRISQGKLENMSKIEKAALR